MISCKGTVDLLVDYLDGALDKETHEELEQHLRECPECVPLVEGYRDISRGSRELLEAQLPPGCAERLSGFLRNRLRQG